MIYDYVDKVLSGKILASKKVILACKRFKNDLENPDFPYFFDEERANKVIQFMGELPDPKTFKTYPIADFQEFIVGNLYGWYRKDEPNVRRFHKAMISVARKNGKSLLISGIALYEFLFGKNPAFSRQIFCTANAKDQAKIVFKMVEKRLSALKSRDEWVNSATKVYRHGEIVNLEDYSYIRPLSRDTGSVDGFEPYLGILDEYAASQTRPWK